ncbi:hypothetical protein ACIF6L_34340 [Kitasatospora sp. NPDC086009]|uniref:hypothetical protein n=1 Tax=unclassified Kitasatospora TaxID=2633591 RepID=UPI0037C55698
MTTEKADHAEYQTCLDGLGPRVLAAWADIVLDRPVQDGALLEQRHVLDEAAHPDTVAALLVLARTARNPEIA